MKRADKNKILLIKNIIFIVCLLLLTTQFRTGFSELVSIDDVTNISLLDYRYNIEIEEYNYLTKQDLKLYTYKLFESILYLFGIFMVLIFMYVSNKNYSWIEVIKKIK